MNQPRFGIELEFFLLDEGGLPALGSTRQVIELWHERGWPNPPVPELGSFQIELNPGPWPLSPQGIEAGIQALAADVARLEQCAADLNFQVSKRAFVPQIGPGQLQDPAFLSQDPRSRATSTYFADGGVTVQFENGSPFTFPGETVLACLNEIHIHAQLQTDRHTIQLFNHLNRNGRDLIAPFQNPLTLNGRTMTSDWNTMRMFEISDGEPSRDHRLRRVGFLPESIYDFTDYQRAVNTFNPIPCPELNPPYLPLESSVWFWVRLRGQVNELRTEFRPMDMGDDWQARTRFLATCCLDQSMAMINDRTWRKTDETCRTG